MIRLGIVGCGKMMRSFAQRLEHVSDLMTLTAAVDLDRARAEALAEDAGGETRVKVATDFREVLDDVDAVLLVLPHHEHYPVAKACLEAGKHVLLEKPMANTEEQCLDLIDTAERHGRVLMVAYVMRYHPLVIKLKELLDSGDYGPCFHMSIWTEQLTRYDDDHWGTRRERLGGGQFFSHGCHYVDLLLWYLGRPVQGCHLGTRMCTPWMDMEGTSDMVMKFESGALGYHFGTWGARGTRLGYSIHAHCEQGMLEVAFRKGKLWLHRFPQLEAARSIEPGLDVQAAQAQHGSSLGSRSETGETLLYEAPIGKQTDRELRHFLECIASGRRPDTDGPRSLQGLRVIWRMYDAERRGIMADLRGLGLDEDPAAVTPTTAGQFG